MVTRDVTCRQRLNSRDGACLPVPASEDDEPAIPVAGRLVRQHLSAMVLVSVVFLSVVPASGSPYTMKGPPLAPEAVAGNGQPDSGTATVLLLAINLYRRFISPTQGPRCGFYPSCSAFGLLAVRHHGPFTGGLMTADRLMRCNALKKPGLDYFQRPDGKLYDPVEANLLKEP